MTVAARLRSPAAIGRQRGAALLIALLAVALAALLALELVERTQRDVARTTAVINAERAWQFAAGMDGMARDWIRRQREAGPRVRVPDGQWSEPFPVPGGTVRGRLSTRDGRFNLNALAARDPVAAGDARRTLVRLFSLLDIDPELADGIIGLVRPGTDDPPLLLAHISELNRLERFTPALRERLRPHLAVLPDPDARINLNRASPEVLAASIEGLSPESARALLARAPFESVDEAMAQPEFAPLNKLVAGKRLTVHSQWYMVQAQVVLNGVVRDYFRLVGVAGNRYDFRYLSQGVP